MGRCCRTPGKKMWPLRNSFIIGDYIMINYISFGGGVQSTAMVLMALAGEIEKPDLVVFADTGTEMPETYETVSRIGKLCNDQNLEFVVVKNYSEKVKGMSLIDWYSSKKCFPVTIHGLGFVLSTLVFTYLLIGSILNLEVHHFIPTIGTIF